jgi:integrating conjugative element protein (TIGR03756 family)
MIKLRLSCLLLIVVTSSQASPQSINSATIIKSTLSALPNCLHYQIPTHFCLWINQWGDINTTPIVSHYLPDLVVSVFNKPHDNPWFEVNKILDGIGKPIQQGIVKGITGLDAGSGSHSFQNEREQNVFFKEVDVIGNPALAIIPGVALLPSTVSPWQPYFQSMTDSLLWRGLPPYALPEEGLALTLGLMHHIGTGLVNWGGICPHEGKVVNDNDLKAAAVIAARAADMVTSNNEFGHVYKNISTECGQHCKASPIQENSKETYFQMIYPVVQTGCTILGEDSSYSSNMLNSDGSYVWVVWRHYEGCADGDGKYIGYT